jgi:hypothetical protein
MKTFICDYDTFHQKTNSVMIDEIEKEDNYLVSIYDDGSVIINHNWMSNNNLPKGKIVIEAFK